MFHLYEFLQFLTPVFILLLFLSNRGMKKRLAQMEQALKVDQKDRQRNLTDADQDQPSLLPPKKEGEQHRRGKALRDNPRSQPLRAKDVVASRRSSLKEANRNTRSDPHLEKVNAWMQAAGSWIKENWFYAMAAACLALAGVFAAQYAASQITFSPLARIALASLFGACLIGAGETIRRKVGDGIGVSTAYLPSVFSSAGIVTFFGAVLTSHLSYGMTTPGAALTLLVGVAALSVMMGWFHGPLLASVGILGATAAPFLVDGSSSSHDLLYGYFLTISLTGLLVNALRKWRFVSALSLLVPFGASSVLFAFLGGAFPYMAVATGFCLISAIFLSGAVRVALPGPILLDGFAAAKRTDGAQRLVALIWSLAGVGILTAGFGGLPELCLSIILTTGLFVLASIWSTRGRGAIDLVGIMAAFVMLTSLLAAVFLRIAGGVIYPSYIQGVSGETLLWTSIASAFALSVTAILHSAFSKGAVARRWAFFAAVTGPVMIGYIEALWAPGSGIGLTMWSGVILSFAAMATFCAERAAHHDKDNHLRMSLAALVAMSMIALSATVVLSNAALSVALAVLVLGAVALDDRFKLRALMLFAQAGAAILVYRALVDPGIFWVGENAALWEVALGYGVPGLLLGASWVMLRGKSYPVTISGIEGATSITLMSCITLLITRYVDLHAAGLHNALHIVTGPLAILWAIAALTSFKAAGAIPRGKTLRGETVARVLRVMVGCWAGMFALIMVLTALVHNPFKVQQEIVGWPFISSLILGYLLPGLVMIWMSFSLTRLKTSIRQMMRASGGFLFSVYVCLSVVHFWRGANPTGVPMGDPELWSYTLALVVIGGGLLLAAIARRSADLRRVANGVLILAIAKAFLIDAPDLEGLLRAGSFLVLGLALAGVAWINRRVAMASTPEGTE